MISANRNSRKAPRLWMSIGGTAQIQIITTAPMTYMDHSRWVGRKKRFNTQQHTATDSSTVVSRMASCPRATGGTSFRSWG